MPDRVHATVDRTEPAELQSVIDRPPPKTKLGELRPGDHPVLALCEIAHRPIHLTLAQFAPHYGAKCDGVAFRPRAAPS